MKKSDLENRMIVECRNGEKYIIIDDVFLSIERVYSLNFDAKSLKLLWEREEIKEVTMAEVEEKFGCKVKIIKE